MSGYKKSSSSISTTAQIDAARRLKQVITLAAFTLVVRATSVKASVQSDGQVVRASRQLGHLNASVETYKSYIGAKSHLALWLT